MNGKLTTPPDLTFGECEGLCGRMVERVGWDRFCFACQEEARQEDEDRWDDLDDENEQLYSVPLDPGRIA